MTDTAFGRASCNIARDFLATAIVIDDQAFLFPAELQNEPKIQTEPLITPGRQGADQAPSTSPPGAESPIAAKTVKSDSEVVSPAVDAQNHDLNGKILIDKFGEFGIVCSVIRPEKAEVKNLDKVLESFAPVADVFVLDWVLYGDKTGAKTKELISTLISDKGGHGDRRVRLVVVYTGELDLEQVTAEIEKDLKSQRAETKKEGFSVLLPGTGTRIVVYGKHGANRVGEAAQRSITPDQLPNMVVREFAEVSRGLLANAVMASVAAIRRNAYQLLSRFPPSLDPAFVTQAILIHPEKASEQIAPLIASEIESLLEDAGIGRLLDASELKNWLEYRIQAGESVPSAGSRVSNDQFKAGFEHMIEHGIGEEGLKNLSKQHGLFQGEVAPGTKKKLAKTLTPRLSSTTLENGGDARLATLMSLRHRYEGAEPQLMLGTIVSNATIKENSHTEVYWICLQPVCDSVRLKSVRAFPLLPLTSVTDTNEHVILIEAGDEIRHLEAKYNPFLIRMFDFAPVLGEQVVAQVVNGQRVFMSNDGTEFRWVAELKPAHAQRMAHRVAVEVARVGLVESEWGRTK